MLAKKNKSKKGGNDEALELFERIDKCERSRQHTLDLSKLGINDWPYEVLSFSNVKVLKGSKNKFVEISSLQSFRVIEELDMSRNLLRSIMNIKFSTLHDLRVIDFSWNKIDVIPDEISKLPLLEYLYMSHNEIREVPECLVELRALQVVDFSHNLIRSLGDQFERMVNLHTLDMSGNFELDLDGLPIRTRRLHEKQQLLKSKSERRALIQRALGVRHDVLMKEQKAIMDGRAEGALQYP